MTTRPDGQAAGACRACMAADTSVHDYPACGATFRSVRDIPDQAKRQAPQ